MMIRHRSAAIAAGGYHSQQATTNYYGHVGTPQHEERKPQRKKRPRKGINHSTIALAGCCFFLGCVISTIVMLCFLPHRPRDAHSPFWKRKVYLAKELQHHDESVQSMGKKCPSYGCPIYPMEMSMLNETSKDFASTDYIMLTHRSNRQKPAPVNQDRIVFIPSFTTDTTSLHDKNNNNNSGDFFIGLFDGHDDKGHETASYASIEIPSQIASKLQEKSTSQGGGEIPSIEMNEIITETFRNVDANAPPIGGGTTAMTVIRIGSKLYLVNTGDSTQYIAIYTPPPSFIESKSNHNERYIHNMTRPTKEQLNLQGTISIHYQNKKHKANFPEEKHRIEKLGGRIHIPPNNPMGSRVIVRSATHREDVGLAMSRSIGDWEWTAVGVIPDPDIQVIDLEEFWKANEIMMKDSKVFVVLGSDGLFDARRVEFVAKHLAYGWFESSHKSEEQTITERMLVVAKKIVNMASPIKTDFYRDDISFVAKVIEL
jgi:serine/threonine protein phosphatase PrpC